jgi:serine protease Do
MTVILMTAVPLLALTSSAADDISGHTGVLATEVLVERCLPAVVQVRSQAAEGTKSGSGFVVKSSGVVVTNLHVVRGATQVAIKLATNEVFDEVRVIGFDEKRDLVLLKFAGFNLPTIPLGDSDQVKQGERLVAIGHPSGLENTVSEGICSNVRVLESGIRVIQTDAAASPGNSGGPLLNKQGQAIGVVSFGVSEKSLIFAYPINYVQGLLELDSQMTLSELSSRLAGKTDLFASGSGIEGRWKSLKSGTIKTLRMDGDFIYGDGSAADGSPYTYELKKQPDGTYSGFGRYPGNCSYFNPWKGFYGTRVEKSCVFESQVTFTKIDPSRIEGRFESREVPPEVGKKAFRDWCDSCGNSVTPVWVDFTWIKVE